MALRDILLPWGVLPPPGEAAPNLSDPITSGLCAISFAHSGGVANIGVLGPVEPAAQRSGTGITVTPGSVGSGTTDGGTRTTNAWRLHSVGGNSAGTAWAIPSGAVTVAALIQRAGNPDGNSPIFGHNVPSSSPYGAWVLFDSTAGSPKFFVSTSSSAFSEITGGAFTNGRLALVVGTWDGATQRLYLNGAQVSSAAASGTIYYNNETGAGNTSGPSIGNYYDFTSGTRSFNGLVHYGAVWDRALSVDEVRLLSGDPLIIFEPQRIWVPVAAGGGGSWSVSLTETASANDSLGAATTALVSLIESASAAEIITAATIAAVALTEAASASDTQTASYSVTGSGSVTESASASDTLDAATTMLRALTETASADDQLAAATTMLRAISESASAVDTPAASYSGAGTATIEELTSATDALTAAATLLVTILEAGSATDALAAATTMVRAITEQATAIDTVAGALPGSTWDVSIEELAAAVDLIAGYAAGGLTVSPLGLRLSAGGRSARLSTTARAPRLSTRTR